MAGGWRLLRTRKYCIRWAQAMEGTPLSETDISPAQGYEYSGSIHPLPIQQCSYLSRSVSFGASRVFGFRNAGAYGLEFRTTVNRHWRRRSTKKAYVGERALCQLR